MTDALQNLRNAILEGESVFADDIIENPDLGRYEVSISLEDAKEIELTLTAPRIKALEWNDDPCPAAKCVFGHYVINETYALVELFIGYGRASITGLGRIQLNQGATADDLKSAAQTDYEARIRSALVEA